MSDFLTTKVKDVRKGDLLASGSRPSPASLFLVVSVTNSPSRYGQVPKIKLELLHIVRDLDAEPRLLVYNALPDRLLWSLVGLRVLQRASGPEGVVG